MSGRFLLDTQDISVQQHIAEAEAVVVASIVLGELYYGARKLARVVANLARIDEFATSSAVLVCDTATAQQYGQIKMF